MERWELGFVFEAVFDVVIVIEIGVLRNFFFLVEVVDRRKKMEFSASLSIDWSQPSDFVSFLVECIQMELVED